MHSFLAPSGRAVFRSYGEPGGLVQLSRRTALAALFFAVATIGIARAADAPVRVVMLGDSITAGLGLPAQDALPAKLEKALRAKGLDVTIQNAGVSGDTSAGGLARLDWSVAEGTDAVIIELGANDALRGSDPKLTREALQAIITRLRARKIAVLLAGMLAPHNLGEDYGKAFDPIFPALAAAHNVVFYPFILDGVAANPALNQRDGIHPTAAGVDIIVERLLPKAEELISRVRAGRS
ncbi:MAG: arylesterase [Alphaproteobacteria bacterium]|nr:arylesterase [Alphaproteobacteria bacterium]